VKDASEALWRVKCIVPKRRSNRWLQGSTASARCRCSAAGTRCADAIVKKLEEGDLPLEKSLELYERGVQLSRFCHARLEEAERRIEMLNERGELRPAPPGLALPGDEER
jgi:exodeoxyribonuclease VII small subunit